MPVAVLANRVTENITRDLTAMGVPAHSGQAGGSLNLTGLPPAVEHIVRAATATADATAMADVELLPPGAEDLRSASRR